MVKSKKTMAKKTMAKKKMMQQAPMMKSGGKVKKAQEGTKTKKSTAFQKYVEKYPTSGRDTLTGGTGSTRGSSKQQNDLTNAFKKTYGKYKPAPTSPRTYVTDKGFNEAAWKESKTEAIKNRIPQKKKGGIIVSSKKFSMKKGGKLTKKK